MGVTAEQQRAWMDQWRAAGPALDRVWKAELRALTLQRALEYAEALLSLPSQVPDRRIRDSGLVEQQRVFASSRR